MSVDAGQDAPDVAEGIPVRLPGSSQEPETWQQPSSKDRSGARVLAGHSFTRLSWGFMQENISDFLPFLLAPLS